jgi:hypothetical protein
LESTTANIAGSFDFDVSAGNFKSWQENGGVNKIALKIFDKSGSQALSYTLNAGKTIEFPIFIAPASGLDLSNMKITVNTDKGKQTFSAKTTTKYSEIFGPVSRGFEASIKFNVSVTGTAGLTNTTHIYVSKENGPFALKASGGTSASYTIDF